MKSLHLSLLSFSLAALLLGCSQESSEDPLIPEVRAISIEGTNEIHAIAIDSDQLQLTGRISYSDGTDSTTSAELKWESNDTSVIYVHNGLLEAKRNSGTVAISASYRDKLFTKTKHNVTIVRLKEINITTDSSTLAITKLNTKLYHGDANDSGPHQLKIYGTFSDGNTTSTSIASNTQWISSDTNVSTIDHAGLLTLRFDKNASSNINVSVYNEVNATLELNVTTSF